MPLNLTRSAGPRPAADPHSASDLQELERELDVLLPELRPGNPVAAAMRYAVQGAAQRVRPALSFGTARLLGPVTPAVLRAAAAVELLHCASLVIDDLPCMDNSPARRGRPSVHLAFGEATAILASFALVAMAARSTMDPIVANGSAARLGKFQWLLLGVLDANSLIAGQSLDLTPATAASQALITELKTVPLFELAVEAGGVSSRDYDRREPELRAFARQFGLAFQMVDDYLDHDFDDRRAALAEVQRARALAANLGSNNSSLLHLVGYLHGKLTQNRSRR